MEKRWPVHVAAALAAASTLAWARGLHDTGWLLVHLCRLGIVGGWRCGAADERPPPGSLQPRACGGWAAERMLVIGAGPAGIATLQQFQELDKRGVPRPEVVVYEQQAEPGGQWTGVRPHSSMYPQMWLNFAYTNVEFPWYSFDDHFDGRQKLFMPREVVQDYMKGALRVADPSGTAVRYNTSVTSVRWDHEHEVFLVDSADARTGRASRTAERFAYVVVAVGHFSHPRVMHIEGFTGNQVHSHSWPGPAGSVGKKVLVVGAGDSATDVLGILIKFGVGSLHVSIRSLDAASVWGTLEKTAFCHVETDWFLNGTAADSIQVFSHRGIDSVHPGIKSANGRTVTFVDGSRLDGVDEIIWATGYSFSFPFMDTPLRLAPTSGERHVYDQLHHTVLWKDNYRLSYVGMSVASITSSVFAAQAALAVAVAANVAVLPPPGSALAEAAEHRFREASNSAFRDAIGEFFPGQFRLDVVHSPFDTSVNNWTFADADELTAPLFETEEACSEASHGQVPSKRGGGSDGTNNGACVFLKEFEANDDINDYDMDVWTVGHLGLQLSEVTRLLTWANFPKARLASGIASFARRVEFNLNYIRGSMDFSSAYYCLECRKQEDPGQPSCGNDTYLTAIARYRDGLGFQGWQERSWNHHTSYEDSRDDSMRCYFDQSQCTDGELAAKFPHKQVTQA